MRRAFLSCTTVALMFVSGCTTSETIQTSKDTAIVQTSAAPICGGRGAARVAYKQAAVSTIRAGYDSFIIVGGSAQNNVRAIQTPGRYQTYGQMNPYGGFSATTTYQPGAMIVAGSHDQSFGVKMFKAGDAGASNAISAREVLGPEWAKIVKNGVNVCS